MKVSVVVLSHLTWINKMEELLDDKFWVQPETQSQSRTQTLVRYWKHKICLDGLLAKNFLSKGHHKFLKLCGSKPSVSYGMC